MYTVDYECITHNIMMSSQTTNYYRYDTAGDHHSLFSIYFYVYGNEHEPAFDCFSKGFCWLRFHFCCCCFCYFISTVSSLISMKFRDQFSFIFPTNIRILLDCCSFFSFSCSFKILKIPRSNTKIPLTYFHANVQHPKKKNNANNFKKTNHWTE